jgi:hypothetical protein
VSPSIDYFVVVLWVIFVIKREIPFRKNREKVKRIKSEGNCAFAKK